MKKDIRTIGIDDAAFKRGESSHTFVFGVVVRGFSLIEGVIRTEIEIDGTDATEKIVQMVVESKFHTQLKAIILNSSTIGAFNIINVHEIYKKTGLKVLVILSHLPNDEEVKKALSNLQNWKSKYKTLKKNPKIREIEYKNQLNRNCKSYIQQIGFENDNEIKELLKKTTDSSCLPECLRLADLIGQSFKNFVLQ